MIVATLEKSRKRSYLIDTDEPFKLLIPGYPEGSNLTILNTAYVGRKKLEDGKVTKDFIFILYKDRSKENSYHL